MKNRRRVLTAILLACALLGAAPARAAAGAGFPATDADRAAVAAIAEVLAAPDRSAADRERDQRDKPAEILALAGIKPGMVVADIFGGGGYWSEIIARIVGPNGRALLVNNPPYVEFAKKDLETRFASGRMAQVERSVVDPASMKLGTATLDAAIIVMSYHDLYYVDEKGGWPAIDAQQFVGQIREALKPGGAFIVIDHAARAGTLAKDAQTLHRIDEDFVRWDLERQGFRLERTWDGLRHPEDDRTKLVFDPGVRGKTDRFLQVYLLRN